ncbi:MAG: hypothetical protein ACRDD7_09210, partial [Peptostreptococcaceae bacterium]
LVNNKTLKGKDNNNIGSTISIPAGSYTLISGLDLGLQYISKGMLLGFNATGTAPTTGVLNVTLLGTVILPNDHRSVEV